jgi:hypothetical protein
MMLMHCDRDDCASTRSLSCEEDTADWLVVHGMDDDQWAKHYCSPDCLLIGLAQSSVPDGMTHG